MRYSRLLARHEFDRSHRTRTWSGVRLGFCEVGLAHPVLRLRLSSLTWTRDRPRRHVARYLLDMDHSRLGRTGLQVSKLCLGTMTFGLQCDEPTSVSILDRAVEGGIDFIDSSDVYPLGGDLTTVGCTEEILGRWLNGKRDRFVLATKCFGRTGPSALDAGNSRRHIFEAVDASLRRLQTDYIDLYQLHGFDSATPIDETLGALDDLVHQGKVRYIGCSKFSHLPVGPRYRTQ